MTGGSLNPAFGFAVNITMLMDGYGKGALDWIWLYLAMPVVGGLLALVFYEFVYKLTKGKQGKTEAPSPNSPDTSVNERPMLDD